jgi:hypothetical protein
LVYFTECLTIWSWFTYSGMSYEVIGRDQWGNNITGLYMATTSQLSYVCRKIIDFFSTFFKWCQIFIAIILRYKADHKSIIYDKLICFPRNIVQLKKSIPKFVLSWSIISILKTSFMFCFLAFLIILFYIWH